MIWLYLEKNAMYLEKKEGKILKGRIHVEAVATFLFFLFFNEKVTE